jgi:glycyl-tRNA synthetase
VENLYERNGLIFWSEDEIAVRETCVDTIVRDLTRCLKTMNSAFEVVRVEAPILTPKEKINANYTFTDMFNLGSTDLVLRPETTMGSYAAAKFLLNTHNERKFRMPIVVWQHGKSFRREQDQPTKFMRLKEFYQLEFQIIYAPNTAMDYSSKVVPQMQTTLSKLLGPCRIEPSDRLPDYAEWTKDVIRESNNMEVCSISMRKDYEGARVLEVAVGSDRCVFNYMN